MANVSNIMTEIENIGNHIKSRTLLFEKFIKECPAPVCMVDPEFKVLLYSNEFVRFFNLAEFGSLQGMSILEISQEPERTELFTKKLGDLQENQAMICGQDEAKISTLSKPVKFSWKAQKFFLENGHKYLGGYFLLCSEHLKKDGDSEWKIIET